MSPEEARTAVWRARAAEAEAATADWPEWKKEHTLTKFSEEARTATQVLDAREEAMREGARNNDYRTAVNPLAPVKGVQFAHTPEGPVMSSREIAELTGKEHKHVLRDIRVMFEGLEMPIGATAQFWTVAQVPGANNSMRNIEVCNLPKDLTITLVSGYNVTMRHRIVTRWMELESSAQQAPAFRLPQTFSEALRLSADLQEANEKLAEEKKLLTMKNEVLAHVNEELAPKAEALDTIAGDAGRLLGTVVRTLKGVNTMAAKPQKTSTTL